MNIVAIRTLQQALVDPVPEGFAEVRLLLRMAAVTELWLLVDEQATLFFRKVRGMARNAAHRVVGVSGAIKVGMLLIRGVARETALTDDLRCLPLEGENLGLVTAAVDVLGARAVARFTSISFGPLFGF